MTELTQSTINAMDSIAGAPKTSDQPLFRAKKYPMWICHDCGTKYCKKGLAKQSLFHPGHCGCCGKDDVLVTEPKTYGHLTVWPLPKDIDPDPLPATLYDLVDKIIDNFDFEKVANHMKNSNHYWLMGNGQQIPEVEDLRRTARTICNNVIASKYDQVETGGFLVKKYIDPDNSINNGIELFFYVTKKEAYLGDYL